jgi:hypothetical protein
VSLRQSNASFTASGRSRISCGNYVILVVRQSSPLCSVWRRSLT